MEISQVIKFKEKLEELELKADEMDSVEFEEQVLQLEEDILNIEGMFEGKDDKQIKEILKKIKEIKKEHDFYDKEAELDMMFPDRQEDDFDNGSMSPESVFGRIIFKSK